MFPVPPPGPGEPAPGFAAPGSALGFAEPSGPDPAARYPGPGLPPSASSLQEGAHLLRAQDPGGSARGHRGAEPNGSPVPGGGGGGGGGGDRGEGAQAWFSRSTGRARGEHGPLRAAPSVRCLAALRSQRPSLPLTGALPQDPRGRGSLAERREEDLGGRSENVVLLSPPFLRARGRESWGSCSRRIALKTGNAPEGFPRRRRWERTRVGRVMCSCGSRTTTWQRCHCTFSRGPLRLPRPRPGSATGSL